MKMKAFLFVCMVVATGAHNVELSKEQKHKIREYSAACIKETGVKPELLAQAKKGHFADDPALKKFTLCFFQKTGILTQDGKLNTEVALSKLPAGVDKMALSRVLDECKKNTGKDKADTAFEVFKCYYRATPAHVVF